MTDNYFDYAVEIKASGKNLFFRILLIALYVLLSAAYFAFFYIVHIPHLIAILPFLLRIVILLTWRHVSFTYRYVIEVGQISFEKIFPNKKRRPLLKLHILDALRIVPAEEAVGIRAERILDFRSAPNAVDGYAILYRDEKGKECLVYFEATAKALKLLSVYNPTAISATKQTRF